MKIDQKLRFKVINFLKMITSYSFLKKIYYLNKEFTVAFENALRKSSEEFELLTRHERELLMYLYVLDIEEKALLNFLGSKFKKEVYSDFISENIHSTIFGRYGDERGLENDPLYKKLGMFGRDSGWIFENLHENEIKKICIANEFTAFIKITLSDFDNEYYIPHYPFLYKKWNFESFNKFLYWSFIRSIKVELIFDNNQINSDIEIFSGEEIQISGIYEPWFEKSVYQKLTNDPEYNVYVGCPNYFLEGSEATQYKLEGTDDWYDVKWRLIWEDNRYIDGTIPEEEKNYIFDIENIGKHANQPETESNEKLSMAAGQVSPKAGYWYTTAKLNSRQYFKKGDIFPDFESDWGEVYWQFDGEE